MWMSVLASVLSVGASWGLVYFVYLKVSLHMPFPHAFSALRCNFQVIMLVSPNQGKYEQNAMHCIYRMQKRHV